jgi:hypothetical protein
MASAESKQLIPLPSAELITCSLSLVVAMIYQKVNHQYIYSLGTRGNIFTKAKPRTDQWFNCTRKLYNRQELAVCIQKHVFGHLFCGVLGDDCDLKWRLLWLPKLFRRPRATLCA